MAEETRLLRLTSIITQLQTKKIVTSTELSQKFGVSVRTIYRDIRALEESGIPIGVEDGKGYFLMEGYRLPPVTFSEDEANALITAEQIILKNKDASLAKNYSEAISKIKSVLRYNTRDNVNLLSKRVISRPLIPHEKTSNSLIAIQMALTHFQVMQLKYHSETKNETTIRKIEPFALYNNLQENWTLIAWCQLRGDFRLFRLDRIEHIEITMEKFEPHKITLEQYLENARKKKLNTPDIPLS
jgi:predicted DNA-binding transcriptional regulator YafY